MKKDFSQNVSDELLRERFGDLTGEELEKLRSKLLEQDFEVVNDGKVHDLLTGAASATEREAPPLPEHVRRSFETARLSAENAKDEVDVYATPKRYQPAESSASPMSRWHTMSVISGGLAAAAAIAVAYVTLIRPVEKTPLITYADEVTLLTPGEETGFLEPIFTWKSGNGGVVNVRVLSSDGKALASLDQAFSPLRWTALEVEVPLASGQSYELELTTPDGEMSRRAFMTKGNASGAPEPEDSLEAILEQCQQLIAADRPADAWMLWGELTSVQKSDPRMQDLKDQILRVIAG